MKQQVGLIAGLLMVTGAIAQLVAPDVLVKTVTYDILGSASRNQEIQHGNTGKAIELLVEKVLPNFDFQRMTALAVGKGWRQASSDQQSALIDEFRTLLVRTYSNALSAYKDQTIEFKPLKATDDETDVLVRTEVKQHGAKSISIDYAMAKNDARWRIYDVNVAGVSLVTSYRSQFAQEVQNGGIDGLIKTLRAKNGAKAAALAKS